MFKLIPEYNITHFLNNMRVKFELMPDHTVELDGEITAEQLLLIAKKFESQFAFNNETNNYEMVIRSTYYEYMKVVDRLLAHHLGFTSGDVEDYDWRAEYTSDVAPDEAVDEYIINFESNW